MFEKLTVFSMRRTRKQAFGFYLAYLGYVLLLVILGGIAGQLAEPGSYKAVLAGCNAGAIVAVFFCTGLSYFIVERKGLPAKEYLYVVATGLFAVASPLVGMAIPAYLTTRSAKSSSQQALQASAELQTLEKETV